MPRKTPLANNILIDKALSELENISSFSKIAIKLKAISSLKHNDIKTISQVFFISKNTLKSWARRFDEEGIEGLYPKQKRSRNPKLPHEHQIILNNWVKSNPSITLKEICLNIKKEFNVNVSQFTAWVYLKKLGLSYITARKKHYKSDKIQQDDFKKNSKKRWK
jgi:transposase